MTAGSGLAVGRDAGLRGLAVAGPVVFTVDWVLLGLSHPGFRPDRETISSLSAHGASGWPVMVAGQVVLAASFVAVAVLCLRRLGRAGRVPATLFLFATIGVLQLSTFRTICTPVDAAWCAPLPRSAFPHQQWAHGVGTGIAFTALLLAGLSWICVTWGQRRWRAVVVTAVLAELVALPSVAWFLYAGPTYHGLAEKTFLTSLAVFTGYAGWRLGEPPATLAPPVG